MKNLIAVLVFVFTTSFTFAQTMDISEAPRAKENGTYNSYLFELPDVGKDGAVKDWEKFMANFKGKTKYNRKAKLYVTENAKMPRLSDGTVDVYARILEDKNPNKRTSVIVWFELADSYVNSESDEQKGEYAKEILTEYGMLTSKHQAQSVLSKEEDRMADLEKRMSKLKKQNKDMLKEIEKAKESLSKNEKGVEVNNLDQKNLVVEMDLQKDIIDRAKENLKKFN